MKLKKLKIENFQSISKIEFNYEETGVFYYRGDNNIGKSSILKAINTLFFNASNMAYKSYIRDGEDSFYISMEDYNGNVVMLARGVEDFYVWNINGESGRYDRTSGRVPQELVDYFGMYYDDKTKESANIRLPRATLLGVDSTAGENNYLLQKALNSEVYTLAYKKADKKRKAILKENDLLFKYHDNVKESIEGMSLEEDERKLDEMNNFKGVLEDEFTKLNNIQNVIQTIEKTMTYREAYKNLKGAVEIFDEFETEHLKSEDITKLVKTDTLITRLEERQVELTSLVNETSESLNEIQGMMGKLDDLKALRQTIERTVQLKKEQKRLSNIEELDNEAIKLLEEYESIKEVVQHYTVYEDLESQLNKNKEELSNLVEEEKELEEELGYCPMCGSEFNAQHSH